MRRLILALLCVLAYLFVPRPTPDRLSALSAGELLARPVDPPPGVAPASDAPALWRELLRSPASAEGGLTLKLGRVLADPSAARLAAEQAGELLRQPAKNAQGELGLPLWKAVLDGPATTRENGAPVLKLYGCRHSADADAGPVLEDTSAARLALARTLRELAAGDPAYSGLTLAGEETPAHGGVNFEVQLVGDRHSVQVSFDGHDAAPLTAERMFRPVAPNDDAARQSLVRGLRDESAADASLAGLVIAGEDAPVPGGIDFRLERFGERQTLSARVEGAATLRVHRDWTPPRTGTTGIVLLAGAIVLLFLWPRRGSRAPARQVTPPLEAVR